MVNKKKKNKTNAGHAVITVTYGILTKTKQTYIRKINYVLTTFY